MTNAMKLLRKQVDRIKMKNKKRHVSLEPLKKKDKNVKKTSNFTKEAASYPGWLLSRAKFGGLHFPTNFLFCMSK